MIDRLTDWYDHNREGSADLVAQDLGLSVLSVRPRIFDLVKLRKLEPTEKRGTTECGCESVVYRRIY